MKILKTENLLNLATQVALPNAIIKGLFIRFSGTAAAGVTVTEAQLGSSRVNYRGQDIVNTDLAGLGLFNNLTEGTHEFASAIGAAFTGSYYVRFTMPWDENNGLINTDADRGTVYVSFPALTAAVIASGTVEIYYEEANTVATYVPIFVNQNLQAGGAGQLTDRFRQFNISSVYVISNAIITGSIIVNKDGQNVINASQAALLGLSNLKNRVETAITLYQLDLNPNQLLGNALSNNVDIVLSAVSGAGTIVCYVLGVLFQQSAIVTQQSFVPTAPGSGGSVSTVQPVKVSVVPGAGA